MPISPGWRSRFLLRALLFSTMLFLGSAARAELAAQQLVDACQDIERHGRVDDTRVELPDTAKAGICLGYFSAIAGVTLFSNPDDTRVLGICTPGRVNVYDLARAGTQFLNANPQYRDERAVVVALSAAKQAYPC